MYVHVHGTHAKATLFILLYDTACKVCAMVDMLLFRCLM